MKEENEYYLNIIRNQLNDWIDCEKMKLTECEYHLKIARQRDNQNEIKLYNSDKNHIKKKIDQFGSLANYISKNID